MNVPVAVASVVLAGMNAWASTVTLEVRQPVVVCMQAGVASPWVVTRAEAIAAQIFAGVGVRIEWKHGERYCKSRSEQTIIVSLSTGAPATRVPGALAYAQPYEGVHIEVFFDRILKTVDPLRVPGLLGHVLAHEITHILQGVNRHSEEGVMKAHWDERDHIEMNWKPLPFTAEDADLIQRGMDSRASRLPKRD
jgi:hypothetical protein